MSRLPAATRFIVWLDASNDEVFHRVTEEPRFGVQYSRRKETGIAWPNSMSLAIECEFRFPFENVDRFCLFNPRVLPVVANNE